MQNNVYFKNRNLNELAPMMTTLRLVVRSHIACTGARKRTGNQLFSELLLVDLKIDTVTRLAY